MVNKKYLVKVEITTTYLIEFDERYPSEPGDMARERIRQRAKKETQAGRAQLAETNIVAVIIKEE